MTFEEAAEKAKHLKGSPSNDELLTTYALYKQATVGDNNAAKPGVLDPKGKAKWEAWNSKKGISSDDAKQKYIAHIESLVAKYGTK